MAKPASVAELNDFGRVRLSKHFFMREMLYSECASFHGVPNIPSDPELCIAAGRKVCVEILEPLWEAFGGISVRSAFRSAEANGFCHERFLAGEKACFCSANTYNAARHIWDRRDEAGFMGATVSVVVPWYIERFEETGDPRPLAWWIRDHIPAYDEILFFPWQCSFNIRWYEGPSQQKILLPPLGDRVLLTGRGLANFEGDHSAEYPGFPGT